MGERVKQTTGPDLKTLDALPVALVLFDKKQIVFLNQAACDLLGFARTGNKRPQRQSFADLVVNTQKPAFKKKLEEFSKSRKKVLSYKLQLEAAKKQLHAGLVINKVQHEGKLLFQASIQVVFPQNEYALDLVKKIGAYSQDVIFHLEFFPVPAIRFISDSSRELLGYTPEQIYKNMSLVASGVHPEDMKYVITSPKDYLRASVNNKFRKAVVRYTNKKNQTRYIEIVGNPLYDAKKKINGMIGNMRDVTGRVDTGQELVDTKEKFDLITNNGNDIIAFYTFLPEEKYLYVSPNIKKILGFSPKQLLADNMFFNKRVIGSKEYFLNTDRQLVAIQKQNIRKNCYYIFKVLNSRGEEIWLESNYFPIINGDGKVGFFLNILRDVTEQREKEIEIQNQYINYRNLLDNSPAAYIIHQQGVCLYCNNAVLQLLRLRNKNQILGKFIIDFFKSSDRKRAIEHINDFSEGKHINRFFNYTITDSEKNNIDIEIKSLLIKFNDVDCVLALINNLSDQRERENARIRTEVMEATNQLLQKEVKERKDAEKSLIEKTAHLSSIFESSTHLIWTVNRNYEVTSFNQNFAKVLKLQHGVDVILGVKIDGLLTKNRQEYIRFWYSKYDETFKGHKLEFEKEDMNYNGRVYRKVFFNPIFNELNEVTGVNCIAHDVTDSKIYEQKLVNQTGKLTAIFDSSHHYIWTISKENRLTSFNKNYFDLLASLYNTEPYIGFVLNRGVLSNDREYNELMDYHYKKAFSGSATNFEIETLDKNHNKIYLEIFLNPIFEGERVAEVSGIAHNVTEKKHVQQRMEQSLKEKEVLLKEVHHRVKNNMQVISSILNLQSSYVSDEYALMLLKESQNRIKTMAYIHESLYQNKSFTSVNFSEYLNTLVNNIVQSYSFSKEKISLNLDIEKIALTLDLSIPVGLIVNELVTNAIKHGFPEARTGVININLKSENNFVLLELEDNGKGFAPDVDFENSHSLGLQLVNTLIEQIEGKLDFRSGKDTGTRIVIRFKM